MTSQVAVHKRNLESSILFIQQEHADTLKGLHVEINQLQKKCTDLTFQLTMNGLSIDEAEDTNKKYLEVKKLLEEQTKSIEQKDLVLTEKDGKIKELEHSVKVYKKKYLDESRKQAEVINRLKADVETKSCTVAYLTSKLHQAKLQNKDSEPSEIRRISSGPMPAPPKEILSKPRRAPNIKRNPESVTLAPILRMSSGRSSESNRSSASNRSDSPNISAFLPPPQKIETEFKKRAKPTILPPIQISQEASSSVLVRNIGHKNRPKTPEVATLALEQLPHRTKTWANPQGSHSSEYK